MSPVYAIEERHLPAVLRRRKRLLGLPIGPKQDYKRQWMLTHDGKPIAFYATKREADERLDELLSLIRPATK